MTDNSIAQSRLTIHASSLVIVPPAEFAIYFTGYLALREPSNAAE